MSSVRDDNCVYAIVPQQTGRREIRRYNPVRWAGRKPSPYIQHYRVLPTHGRRIGEASHPGPVLHAVFYRLSPTMGSASEKPTTQDRLSLEIKQWKA
eukprot:1127047-Pyramimonas_sp.AAC.1